MYPYSPDSLEKCEYYKKYDCPYTHDSNCNIDTCCIIEKYRMILRKIKIGKIQKKIKK